MAKKQVEVAEVSADIKEKFEAMFAAMAELGDALGIEVSTGGGDEVDLSAMDEDALIAFAEQNGIDVPRKCKTADDIREYIATALGVTADAGAEAGDNEEEIDLEKLGEEELEKFAEEQGIDLPRKCKTAEDMRAFIAEYYAKQGEAEAAPEEKPAKKGRVEEPDAPAAATRKKLADKARATGAATKKGR